MSKRVVKYEWRGASHKALFDAASHGHPSVAVERALRARVGRDVELLSEDGDDLFMAVYFDGVRYIRALVRML